MTIMDFKKTDQTQTTDGYHSWQSHFPCY